jgi:hypothetical protein
MRVLLKQGLLIKFQAAQVGAGKSKALMLGNYNDHHGKITGAKWVKADSGRVMNE